MKTILKLAAAALLLTAGAAEAQDYPSKAVTIIVPFAAGGASDLVTRTMAEGLQKLWNQPVVVENVPGGGTIIAVNQVAKSAPDGYTMGMVSGSFTVNAATRKSLPYDTLKDLRPVTVFIDAPQAITSHKGFGPNNLEELIAEAKSRPAEDPVSFATSGIATPSHMFVELLESKAGIKLQHVPYGGAAESLPDVLSGRVDFQTGPWSDVKPHVDAGNLKLIGTLYERRLEQFPDMETVGEVIPELVGFPMGAWNAIVVPAGVPENVFQKIATDMQAVEKSQEFQDKIRAMGTYPRVSTPEEAKAHIENLVNAFTEISNTQNIKVE